MAVEANITEEDEWFIGEKKIIEIQLFKDDEVTLEEDIDQKTYSFAVRQSWRDPNAFIEKESGAGVEVTDVGQAKVQITVEAADYPTGLRPGTYIFALKRVDSGNEQIQTYGSVVLQKAAL